MSSLEEVEARAIESAKAAVKEARRKQESYESLLAAARAVVDDFKHERPILRTSLTALQDAVKAAEREGDG